MTAIPPNPGPDATALDYIKCSAKQCRAAARWSVVWNNPKIHTSDREKIWSACDDHRDHLEKYLRDRRMNVIRVQRLEESTS